GAVPSPWTQHDRQLRQPVRTVRTRYEREVRHLFDAGRRPNPQRARVVARPCREQASALLSRPPLEQHEMKPFVVRPGGLGPIRVAAANLERRRQRRAAALGDSAVDGQVAADAARAEWVAEELAALRQRVVCVRVVANAGLMILEPDAALATLHETRERH